MSTPRMVLDQLVGDVRAVALVKGAERYVWLFDDVSILLWHLLAEN